MAQSTPMLVHPIQAQSVRAPHTNGRVSKRQRALLALQHPHITRLRLHPVPRHMHLIEEQPLGPTLAERLAWRRQTPYGLPQVIEMLTPVVAALQYAHKLGVAHGNLHPAALIEMPYGLIVGAFADVGKPGPAIYHAPEHGRDPYNTAGDVYALAVIVYELLTGVRPGSEQPPVSKLTPGVDAVLARAMSGNPRRRPRSPQAFLSALQHVSTRRKCLPPSFMRTHTLTAALIIGSLLLSAGLGALLAIAW